ncbi:MAG: hypothetical protein QNJ14_15555 [Woeseiaceae bacterium]|nr:hypothetical protein [Woeseiaceae bacterium]
MDKRDAGAERLFYIGTFQVEYRVPSGESVNYPPRAPLVEVSTNDPDLLNYPYTVEFFRRHWEFSSGFRFKTDGVLGLSLRVQRTPESGDLETGSQDLLAETIVSGLSEAGYRDVTQVEVPGSLPDFWVAVTTPEPLDLLLLGAPIGGPYFVVVQGNFVDNSRGSRTEWKAEAKEILMSVARSLRSRPTAIDRNQPPSELR